MDHARGAVCDGATGRAEPFPSGLLQVEKGSATHCERVLGLVIQLCIHVNPDLRPPQSAAACMASGKPLSLTGTDTSWGPRAQAWPAGP